MTLQEFAREEYQKLIASSKPVDPAIIEKFRQDLAEDYQKYEIENKSRIVRTRQLSDRTIIV